MKRIKAWVWVVLIVIVALIPAVIALIAHQSTTAPTTDTATAPAATSTPETATSTATTSPAVTPTISSTKPAPAPVQQSAIHFITPVAGDAWKLETSNSISWNASSGATGQIYLLDAKTKTFIGVILDSTGPAQTAYTWNTRDVYLSRTNPLKKTILPGNYVMVMSFDQGNLPSVTSPAFTVTK